MTPEEKGKELIEKFRPLINGTVNPASLAEYKKLHGDGKKSIAAVMRVDAELKAKQCALICVDEILNTLPEAESLKRNNVHIDFDALENVTLGDNNKMPLEEMFNLYYQTGVMVIGISKDYEFWQQVKQCIQNA